MKSAVKNALLLILAILVLMFVDSAALSDVSQRLNYQGRLTDSNGVPLADGSYNMVFEIYDAETGGTSVWDQAMSVTLEDGLFSYVLGSTSDPLSGVNWNQDLWIQVTVGATTYTPRQRLTGVTYALTVPEGSISTAKLADDAVTSAKVLDNELTAADQSVNVVSSVDGVTNDGGNIDLIAGSGIAISPDDGADTITIAVSGASIDHGSITGLLYDDHPQYFALAQNESVTGVPAFNGGTSGTSAPFSVDSTYLVSNLNADLLDGYEASYFMTAATDNWVNTTGDTMTGALLMSGANGDITFNAAAANITLAGGSISDSAGNVKVNDTVDITGGLSVTGQITSTLADGTAPMAITSTTKVSNLNVDRLDDYHAGNSNGNIPVSNGTVNVNLNADLLDGQHYTDLQGEFVNVTGDTRTGALAMSGAGGDITFDNAGGNLTMAGGTITDTVGAVLLSDTVTVNNTLTMTGANGDITFDNAGGNITLAGGNISDSAGNVNVNDTVDVTGGISYTGQLTSSVATGTAPIVVDSTTVATRLNADMIDGYHAGNSSGNIPVSDGAVNTNLNADMVGGLHGNWATIIDEDITIDTTGYTIDFTGYTNSIYKIYFHGKVVSVTNCNDNHVRMKFNGSTSSLRSDYTILYSGGSWTYNNGGGEPDKGEVFRNNWNACSHAALDMTLYATSSSLAKFATYDAETHETNNAHSTMRFMGDVSWYDTTSTLFNVSFYMNAANNKLDGHLVVLAKKSTTTTP